MTAIVFENLAALPVQMHSLRMLLAKLARAIDALVRARAARAVPEWQMEEVQSQIARCCVLIQTATPASQSNVKPVSTSRLRKKGIS